MQCRSFDAWSALTANQSDIQHVIPRLDACKRQLQHETPTVWSTPSKTQHIHHKTSCPLISLSPLSCPSSFILFGVHRCCYSYLKRMQFVPMLRVQLGTSRQVFLAFTQYRMPVASPTTAPATLTQSHKPVGRPCCHQYGSYLLSTYENARLFAKPSGW